MLFINRLTFWLSNSIMLRAIVGHTIGKQQPSAGRSVNNNGNGKFSIEGFDNWDDPKTFMTALQKFESWIFSRIVESVWWQVSLYRYNLIFLHIFFSVARMI